KPMQPANLAEMAQEAGTEAKQAGSWLLRLDAWFGLAIELLAAALVLAEVIILFSGVAARYGFRAPLVWTGELASILFLWLAMLGAVVAFRRSEHMRMTALVSRAGPNMRAFLEALALAAGLAFLGLLILPAYEHAMGEVFITTPALEISNIWRAAALPAGL